MKTTPEKREYMRQWRANNKAKTASYHREYRFGVTQEQYDAMLSAQDFKCAICRTDDPGQNRGWRVDHCHTTGTVRGLLCNGCNVGLGHFKDDTTALQAAIEYLQKQ